MKLNFSYFLTFGVFLTLTFLATTQVAAQESIPGYEVQDDPLRQEDINEEKTLIFEPFREARDTTFIPAPAIRQATSKKTSEPLKSTPGGPKNDQEDPLSFNFLYYIIQKFKASDIID